METEFKIQQALDTLTADCTTIVVAQRISSALTADQIILLDSGRIVGCGTHGQLLETSPIYQEIYRSQLGGNG
jgi:ATP-binding cassette subfamily B protein